MFGKQISVIKLQNVVNLQKMNVKPMLKHVNILQVNKAVRVLQVVIHILLKMIVNKIQIVNIPLPKEHAIEKIFNVPAFLVLIALLIKLVLILLKSKLVD